MRKQIRIYLSVVLCVLLCIPSIGVHAAADSENEAVYYVKAGDTLNKIAADYQVSVLELVTINNIKNPDVILVNQKLVIPVKNDPAKESDKESNKELNKNSNKDSNKNSNKKSNTSSAKPYLGKTVILHTNDVHGAIDKYAYVKGLKYTFEKNGAEVILVDAGDFCQGSVYVSNSKGKTAVTMMNKVGYDIVTLGNHEFDYGTKQLKKIMKKADFAVLSSTVTGKNSQPLFNRTASFVTKSGMKLGFIGVTTPSTTTSTNPTNLTNVNILSNQDFYEEIKSDIDMLSDSDLIICLSHLGNDKFLEPHSSYNLYDKIDGIDFIIDGHSHHTFTEGPNGEPIQSTGTKLENIGVIVIDNATKKIESNYLYEVTEDSPKSAAVSRKAEKIMNGVIEAYSTPIGSTKVALNGIADPGNRNEETNLGDYVTDSLLWYMTQPDNLKALEIEKENVVALTNGGAIRASINPGEITSLDFKSVSPFENTLTVVYVKGSTLLNILEASSFATPLAVGSFPQVSGINFTIDTTKEYDSLPEKYGSSVYSGPASINRVTVNDINGKPFDPEATYAIVTNDFISNGGDAYYELSKSEHIIDTGFDLVEIEIEYLKKALNGVIDERYELPAGRINIIRDADEIDNAA